ncbi:hypothetical protein DY000_02060144 [Brassica cretica]|uniref:Uncharacterized protein n=1 Tax=Brassica cretica TaxID=69181 RepID=A0ABQ7AVU6_BRACR|nr:hypothetical protein DY000_02060144 [Brassica cretica]
MSPRKRISDDALPSSFGPKSLGVRDGEIVPKIEFVLHSINREQFVEYWFATYGLQAPPPEPWCPPRPRGRREAATPIVFLKYFQLQVPDTNYIKPAKEIIKGFLYPQDIKNRIQALRIIIKHVGKH